MIKRLNIVDLSSRFWLSSLGHLSWFSLSSLGHLSWFSLSSLGHPSWFWLSSLGYLSWFWLSSLGHLSWFWLSSLGHLSWFWLSSLGNIFSCSERLLNYLAFNYYDFEIPDEGHYRNSLCTLNQICPFLFIAHKYQSFFKIE